LAAGSAAPAASAAAEPDLGAAVDGSRRDARRGIFAEIRNDQQHLAKGSNTMAKQSILGRIAQLMKANINSIIDQAEDPEKMLDQMVRDFTNNIADAESAIAETIGNLRMLEDDHAEDLEAASEWGEKALAASRQADKLRAGGNTADADKFDNLARVALQRQIQSEKEAKTAEPQIASQTIVVDKLKSGLNGMKDKLEQLKSKRSELVARAKSAEAQTKVMDAVKSVDIMDPTSEVGRFEDKIKREEARVRGASELAASSLDSQFNELDDLGELTEVDARLVALKAGSAQASPAVGTGGPTAPYSGQ
jgi:phage shock protein A